MRITKLHIILLAVIVAGAGIYLSNVQRQKKQQLKEKAEMELRQEQERLQLEKRCLAEEIERKKETAIRAVAVAGEYLIIAKKENRDVSKGQETLRQAKESLANENFDEAILLARQSINEFKESPMAKIYYETKRGDCLWKIAQMPRHYGRGSMWTKIWYANKKKIPDFDLIYTHQVLLIPK